MISGYNGQGATVLITPTRPIHDADRSRIAMPTKHRTTTPQNPVDGSKLLPRQSDWDRFFRYVEKLGNGCWLWTGGHGRYGYFSFGCRNIAAHRFVYRAWPTTPQIPDDKPQIDHLCRNTLCVNPDHLEPVTNKENSLRGVSFSAVNARKTHCIHGHEYTPENTITHFGPWGAPGRKCRTCSNERRRSKS